MTTQAAQAQFIRDSVAHLGYEERRAIAQFCEALQNQYTRPHARALLLDAAGELKRKGKAK